MSFNNTGRCDGSCDTCDCPPQKDKTIGAAMSENKQVLTDEQIKEIVHRHGALRMQRGTTELCRAIEAAVLSASAGEKKDAERLDYLYQAICVKPYIAPIVNKSKWLESIDEDIRATNSMQSTKEEK